MTRTDRVRDYYRAIDNGRYVELRDLLGREFVHDRPDRTLYGRERFVSFMREERPDPNTTHALDAITAGERVVAEGRLLDEAGESIFRFADSFRFDDGRLIRLVTYTNGTSRE